MPLRRRASAPPRVFWQASPSSSRSVSPASREICKRAHTAIDILVPAASCPPHASPSSSEGHAERPSITVSLPAPVPTRGIGSATPDIGARDEVTTETRFSIMRDWVSYSAGLTSPPTLAPPNCSDSGHSPRSARLTRDPATGASSRRYSAIRLQQGLPAKANSPRAESPYNSDTIVPTRPSVYVHDNTRQLRRLHTHTRSEILSNMNTHHSHESVTSHAITNNSIPVASGAHAKPIAHMESLTIVDFPSTPVDNLSQHVPPSSAPPLRTIRRKTSITCLRSQHVRVSAPPPQSPVTRSVFVSPESALAPRAQSFAPRHRVGDEAAHTAVSFGETSRSVHTRSRSQPSSVRIGHPQRPYYSIIRKNMQPFSPPYSSQPPSPARQRPMSLSPSELTPGLSPSSALWSSRSSSPSPSSVATPTWVPASAAAHSRCASRASSYGHHGPPSFLDVDVDDEDYLFSSLTPAARAHPPRGTCASDPYLGAGDAGSMYRPLGLNLGFGAVAHGLGLRGAGRASEAARKPGALPGIVGGPASGGLKSGVRFGDFTKEQFRRFREATRVDVVPVNVRVRRFGRGLRELVQGKKE
ncbi:hypothetical protein HGRIS_000960 [Hohenbuehelia grisea]